VPRRREPADPDESSAAIRESIRRIADQRERARIDVGRALVNYAGVEHAIAAQRAHLAASRADIEDAIAAATAAGERAGAEALAAARQAGLDEAQAQAAARAAAAPYEHASTGLQRQRDVIDGTAGQLEAAAEAAAGEISRGRALLVASAASLDATLKEQVALLVRLERAERARAIARARRPQP
jgi:hypothetical protein